MEYILQSFNLLLLLLLRLWLLCSVYFMYAKLHYNFQRSTGLLPLLLDLFFLTPPQSTVESYLIRLVEQALGRARTAFHPPEELVF